MNSAPINSVPIPDLETIRYSHLSGKYKHYCPDWDYMAIDEHSLEWECCTCYKSYDRLPALWAILASLSIAAILWLIVLATADYTIG